MARARKRNIMILKEDKQAQGPNNNRNGKRLDVRKKCKDITKEPKQK
jgi:hypothetical protein